MNKIDVSVDSGTKKERSLHGEKFISKKINCSSSAVELIIDHRSLIILSHRTEMKEKVTI